MVHGQKTKSQNRSTIVTNSIKTLNMGHIKKTPKSCGGGEGGREERARVPHGAAGLAGVRVGGSVYGRREQRARRA